jgi:hypothetical protein
MNSLTPPSAAPPSNEPHVLGLRSTRSLILPDIEFDFIPRLRIDIPRFEISDVKKDVAAAPVRLDKSEAPISNERLDNSSSHIAFISPLCRDPRRCC